MGDTPATRDGAGPRAAHPTSNGCRARLRPGTQARDERVLELRRLVHDHLDPVGVPHACSGSGWRSAGRAARRTAGSLVGFMVTFVGLAMAEVCSSYPTAGGLYYWSAKLAKRNGPAWSWFTGWFNMLGQVAITAGIDFGLAAIFSGFLNIGFDVDTTKIILIIIYTVVLVLHGLLNTFGVRLVALLQRRQRLVARVRRAHRDARAACSCPTSTRASRSIFSYSSRRPDGRRHGRTGASSTAPASRRARSRSSASRRTSS